MLGIRWIVLGIPWVCQGQVLWARLVLVQVWVLQTLFLGDGVNPTRVDRGLSRMGGYWGGICVKVQGLKGAMCTSCSRGVAQVQWVAL